nr:transposase [Clostridia bacterium]
MNSQKKRLVTYNPDLARKKRYEINRLVEKARELTLSKAKRNEYGECSKYVTFSSTSKGKITDDKVKVTVNQEAIEEDLNLAGYNLLVTSETKMKDKDIYDTYHNLWRIEESFRIMKSDLDARPVFLQRENTIKGHFFICYITVLLERLLQFIELKNEFSSSDIYSFFKELKVVKDEHININITASNDFIKSLAEKTKLPILNSRSSEKQIKKVLEYKL